MIQCNLSPVYHDVCHIVPQVVLETTHLSVLSGFRHAICGTAALDSERLELSIAMVQASCIPNCATNPIFQ